MREKKIRGLRRRQKEIDRWRRNEHALDLNEVKGTERCWVKLDLGPWASPFTAAQPPADYRNQLLQGLLEIHDTWARQLDTLDVPYYLAIWLFDPTFMRSQVVCALGDYIRHYGSVFENIQTPSRFPHERFATSHSWLAKLRWAPKQEVDYLTLEEWEEDGWAEDRRARAKLRSGRFRRVEGPSGQPLIRIPLARVWVGSHPREAPSSPLG